MRLRALAFARALFSITFLFGSVWGQAQKENPRQPQKQQTAPLSPQELFKHLSPSVFVVEALDIQGSVVAFGSGVALAPNLVIINIHVIENRSAIRVRHGSKLWAAVVTSRDDDHDLCSLEVKGLNAPPVGVQHLSSLAVGERVFSIGAPEGLELTFSDGLISGFREYKNTRAIQTTAAVSPGSSGGGLFDVQGRLVGITTFTLEEGQNLNFALPADLVLTLKDRVGSEERLKRVESTQSAASRARDWSLKGDAARNVGNMKNAVGCYLAAENAYEEAIRLNPKDADLWLNLAKVYSNFDDHDQVIRACKESLKLQPDNAAAHFLLGTYSDDRSVSIAEWRRAVQLQPENTEFHKMLGIALRTDKDFEGAIAEFLQLARLEPGRADSHYLLGGALYDKGNLDDAIAEFRQSVRLEPGDHLSHSSLGWALYRKNDLAGAIKELGHAVELEPNKGYLHREYGVVLDADENFNGAIVQFREALRLDPEDYVCHRYLGEVLCKKEDWDGAIVEFRAALRLDPKDHRSYLGLGLALGEKGDWQGAIPQLLEAVRHKSESALAYSWLGDAYNHSGKYQEAVAACKQAVQNDQNSIFSHMVLGHTYVAMRDTKLALTEYEALKNLDRKSADMLWNLIKKMDSVTPAPEGPRAMDNVDIRVGTPFLLNRNELVLVYVVINNTRGDIIFDCTHSRYVLKNNKPDAKIYLRFRSGVHIQGSFTPEADIELKVEPCDLPRDLPGLP